ncbi:MAG: hypothetical protein ACLR2O_08950 [Coprococcus sp.]
MRLEPNNLQYQMFLQRMEGGSGWYLRAAVHVADFLRWEAADFCVKLCIANIMCNLFCGGGMCCRRNHSGWIGFGVRDIRGKTES